MESFLKNTRKYIYLGVVLLIFSSAYGMTNVNKVYLNNNFIGCTQDKVGVKNLYNNILSEIEKDFSIVQKDLNLLRFVKSNDSFKLSTNKELKTSILANLNFKVEAYQMFLDNVNVGCVSSFKEGDRVLETLKNKTIENIDYEIKEVYDIAMQDNVSYDKDMVHIKDINTHDEIVDNIKKLKKSKDLAKIEVVEVRKDVEEFAQNTKEITTEDLCLGEVIKKDGRPGIKEVKKKNTYIDGEIVNSSVMEEVVLEEPVDDLVYKGIQNPVQSGIEFLSYPGIDKYITSPFGTRWGTEHHSGIDLGGRTGDPIVASFEGVVKYAGWLGGYGNAIIISHGSGVETLYAHASKLNCSTGQRVSKGDKIAEVGSTGRSTGPHIHFELRSNGKAINPIEYMKS